MFVCCSYVIAMVISCLYSNVVNAREFCMKFYFSVTQFQTFSKEYSMYHIIYFS
uniref:Uncharacterized protein n=1 Tax=Arundo donax TaxID=35708 RepID=A0A0A9FC21_ARUDO